MKRVRVESFYGHHTNVAGGMCAFMSNLRAEDVLSVTMIPAATPDYDTYEVAMGCITYLKEEGAKDEG